MKNSKQLINNFVLKNFFPLLLSKDCPKKLNSKKLLKEFYDDTINEQDSDIMAEKHTQQLLATINHRLAGWENMGIPLPCSTSISNQNLSLFITWRHPKYFDLTGLHPISENFVKIFEWFETLDSKDFFIPCLVYLKMLGANRIFISDGSGDCGIDIIAKIENKPLSSFAFFVQVKTAQNKKFISRDTVLVEYGKYLSLVNDQKFQIYKRALKLENHVDGACYCYVIFTNQTFHDASKEISSKLGILLRSNLQIAYYLSQQYSFEQLRDFKERMNLDFKANFELNIADELGWLDQQEN